MFLRTCREGIRYRRLKMKTVKNKPNLSVSTIYHELMTYSYNESQRDALFLKFIFDKEFYMFRTCPLSVIRSISTLYTQQ